MAGRQALQNYDVETLVLATDTSPTRFALNAFSANGQEQTQRLQVPEVDAIQRYLPIDPYSDSVWPYSKMSTLNWFMATAV